MEPVNDHVCTLTATRSLINRAWGHGHGDRAQDTLLNRAVALKILYPELTRPFVCERFRREAQRPESLAPQYRAVFDWGEDEGTYFIVMELIDGLSAEMLRGSKT